MEISETCRILITLQNLLENAIIPVLKQSVSKIVSCVMDEDAFGHFEVATLFITGNFLPIKQYNDIYNKVIITEMKNELDLKTSKYTYKTKFKLYIKTCSNTQTKLQNTLVGSEHIKPFCFDIFAIGELRKVASKTYFQCYSSVYSGCKLFDHRGTGRKDGGTTNLIMVRGEELSDNVIRMRHSGQFSSFSKDLFDLQ